MKHSLLMLITVAIVVVQVRAEEPPCKSGDQDCISRFAREWALATKTGASAVEEGVASTNTGITNLASPSQSSAKDFLSTLAAALLVPMSGDGSLPLALDYNVPIHLFGEQRFKLQAVLAKPELSADVKQRLAGDAAAMTTARDSLSQLDDVTVSGTLEPSTLGLGRSLTPHRDEYMTLLTGRLLAEAEDTGALTPTSADQMVIDFAGKFAMLLSNQPQLYGSVLYRARRNLAGPNEQAIRFTYEHGFHSLNEFYKKRSDCKRLNGNEMDCARALDAFAGTTITNDPAYRLAVSIEYRKADDVSVALPTVSFNASDTHSFIYSVTYGRNNMVSEKGRLDLALNYEDTTVSNVTDLIPTTAITTEPPKAVRDRFVASATYTYKINGQMAMPLSLIYANHAAYLGDVDRRLNAHIGITFKMP